MRHVAAAAVIAAAMITVQPPTTAADTEGCASRAEYDQLEVGMSPQSVRNLFDIPGHYGPDGDVQFSIEFKSCWAPGEKSVRVWFDWDDFLSRRWLIVDA